MSFLDSWLGTDELQQTGIDADNRLAELNRRALESGHWSKGQFDQAEKDRKAGWQGSDTKKLVQDEFDAGWDESQNRITGGIKGFIGSVIDQTGLTILKSIPWQLWVAGALYLLYQFGWLTKLLKRFRAK